MNIPEPLSLFYLFILFFRQLTPIYKQSNSGGFYEQKMMNLKNRAHGFCVEGSHLVEPKAVCENLTWFERSSHFFEHENARFRDG